MKKLLKKQIIKTDLYIHTCPQVAAPTSNFSKKKKWFLSSKQITENTIKRLIEGMLEKIKLFIKKKEKIKLFIKIKRKKIISKTHISQAAKKNIPKAYSH